MGTVVQRNKAVDLLKVLLTIGIVFRHAELVGWAERSAAFSGFNRGMMLFTSLCVPLFFVISGYLFFLNVPEKPKPRYFIDKIHSRVFSLLIPYLIANALAFVCYWLAHRFAPDMIAGFLGENWHRPLFVFWTGPVNLSLWFIRDLLYAVVLSPLIWLFVRYTRVWGVLALGVVWYFYGIQPWYNFYFILGAWASVSKIDVGGACCKAGPWFLLMYICSFVVALAQPSLEKLSLMAGLPLCVFAAEKLVKSLKWEVSVQWSAWCFFIYLYHYLPEIILKKVLGMFIDPNGFWSLTLVYLLVALLSLALITGIYMVMNRLMPRVTRFLVGGKG